MSQVESTTITRWVASLEQACGKRIVLRGVRVPNPRFRGRIVERPGGIVVEYHDDTAGYFWHYGIIEELLGHLARGRSNVVLYEGDIQYADVPLKHVAR